jgi:predicted phage tail protein
MKTVLLYGEMRKKFGREFRLDVKTPAEAVRALCYQIKGFKAYLHQHGQDAFKVFVGGRNSSDELSGPCSDKEVIRIVPVIQGAGAIGRIVLGVILLVIAYFCPYLAPVLQPMAFSLILGGVIEMLSPVAKTDSSGSGESIENKPSYNFNGPVNTQAQGHPVPLAYGRVMCGSAVISAGMTTV